MNYYEILEVSTNASKEVIKNAYRALIKKYHPDSYIGNKVYAENKLKKINEAYEVLSDDNKRLLYDYDNGFKIDPNAPTKSETEQTYDKPTEHKQNDTKNDKKVVSKKDELKNKIIEIFKNRRNVVICIVSLFLVAFVFGFIISSPNEENEKDNQDEEVTVNEEKDEDKQDTTIDKNYNYNNYNNYSDKNNYNQNNNTYENSNDNIENEVDSNNENNNINEDIPQEDNNMGIS